MTPDLAPVITALDDDDAIWDKDKGGLDRTKPFVVSNPGNGPANKEHLAIVARDMDDPKFATEKQGIENYRTTIIAFEPKIFTRGVEKIGIPIDGMQFLVPLNETGAIPVPKGDERAETASRANAERNMSLIRQHNANPDGFTTPYTMEQARLIYGPLITTEGIAPDGSGTPLSAEQIIENLSKARNVNPSYGTVTANCQMNALVKMMRTLNIPEETIKAGIGGMRRVDFANMAKASQNGIFPSTVIFEGANDQLAARFIGGKVPPVPDDHAHTSVVPLDYHRIKVYQTLPEEVYNPGKKPTTEEKAQEDAIRRNLPDAVETKVTSSHETVKDKILGYLGLDGFRVKDPNVHQPAHLTCEATPGNEVQGRDPDLLYKLMADMMTREDSRDVSHHFKQQQAVDTSGHLSHSTEVQAIAAEMKEFTRAATTCQKKDGKEMDITEATARHGTGGGTPNPNKQSLGL